MIEDFFKEVIIMERLIEKDRTYRIPKENGETDLYQVVSIGNELRLKNIKTGTIKNVNKSNFQKRLDAGEIYVSANLIDVLKKLI